MRRRTFSTPRALLMDASDQLRHVLSVVVLLGTSFAITSASEFNYEVSSRVHERLSDYMSDPVTIARLISEYRTNFGFPNFMTAPDRNAYMRLNDALMTLFPHSESIYYGLEDGVFVGHGFGSRIGTYREPGESGFNVTDPSMVKHFRSCVDDVGNEEECIMSPGGPFVECIDGCSLAKCDDEESQRDCSIIESDSERSECESKIKWCKQYVRKTAPSEDDGNTSNLGYIPRSMNCIDHTGVASQTPGAITKKDTDFPGNCYYNDGITPVERILAGDYAYCGGNGTVCDDTFKGAYMDRDYDPRWRGWYEDTRAIQSSNWSPPYPFFTTLAMGITYSEPIYTMDGDGRNVFAGVIAVDYTFENITEFLVDNYFNSTTTVAIFEDDAPHYVIASSTGSKAASKVRIPNEALPCPEEQSADCKAVRTPIADISETQMDIVVARAFERQKEQGFPEAELVSVKADDSTYSPAYVSQTQLFEAPAADLTWRIIIMAPTQPSSADTILKGDTLFGFLIVIGLLGFSACLILFSKFYKHRATRTMIASDWRFTSAFILGCSLLNTASFSFLGPNTDQLCMLRMWLFHCFFVLALSPLLAKTYRMMKLVGGQSARKITISHAKAGVYTLPIIVTQVIILIVFTLVDPSRQVEIIEMNGVDVTHRIICGHNTKAFFIVELIFEGGLVLLGCLLAYKTRNLKGKFGEAKQLIIAMYNIAVVGSVLVIVINVMNSDQAARRILISIGILWGSVFSCCAFVIPRLLQIRENNRGSDTPLDPDGGIKENRVQVSGITSDLHGSSSVLMARRDSKEFDREFVMNRITEEVFDDG